jgi:putative transposase
MLVPTRKDIRLSRDQYIGRQIYFVTICCEDGVPIFRDPDRCKTAIDTLKCVSDSMRFLTHAYCIMPDHIHLLVEAEIVTSDLVGFVAKWKQATGYLFRQELPARFRQRRFYDHVLRQAKDSEAVAWYIWMNPLRTGMVSEPHQYPFSASFTVGMAEGLRAFHTMASTMERTKRRDALKCSLHEPKTFLVLDEDARVHHHEESRGARLFRGFVVHNAELHPDNFGSGTNRAIDRRRNVCGPPKNIDNLDSLGNVLHTRVTFLLEHFTLVGIHGDDSVSGALHVTRDAMARPRGIRGQSNDSNRLVLA